MVLGIPALFFFLLYFNRHRLDQPEVANKLGFLYQAYNLQIWWFEVVVCTTFAPNLMLRFTLDRTCW